MKKCGASPGLGVSQTTVTAFMVYGGSGAVQPPWRIPYRPPNIR